MNVAGLEGFRIGHATLAGAHSGCSVVLAPQGALGAVAVRGGGPGTREAAALGATGTVTECHATVLSGGSAFGLATADGVVDWCEVHGIGYDKAVARIPIVGGAIVFDLREPGQARPGRDEGWAACEAATEEEPATGLVGVGAGCTVGKVAGLEHGVPGGVGWAVATGGGVAVGALMAVNALGDVLDERGEVLAGSLAPAGAPRYPVAAPSWDDAVDGPAEAEEPVAATRPDEAMPTPGEAEHTVIGCLLTNARLTKTDAVRAADLAHTGIARAIEPPHTAFDGDALFLLCAQRVEASVDLVAHLGARAVAAAIRQAVRASG